MAYLLVQNGTDPAQATNNGETIVSLAEASGNEEMKQLCSQKKISPASTVPKPSDESKEESDLVYESMAYLRHIESLTEQSTGFDPLLKHFPWRCPLAIPIYSRLIFAFADSVLVCGPEQRPLLPELRERMFKPRVSILSTA